MRICSPQLGISPESVLGGEVFDREILTGLAEKGTDLEIIIPKGKDLDKSIKKWHLTFIPISHFPPIFFNFLILPYLFFIYRKRPFEILRIHQPQFIGLGALLFKLINPRVKLVATYHQFGESKFLLFSKLINKVWDHIICDSQNVQNKLIKYYEVPRSKITVVHSGTPSYLKPSSQDKGLVRKMRLQNKAVLLYMGLFIKRKNPLFLLDVLKRITLKNKNVLLIYWGQGPLQKEIIEKSKKLNIQNNVKIQKPLFGKEKSKIHSLADIFVHPALDEGFALAPLEAMACSKPLIMNKAHSAKEIVDHGVNGYICKINNVTDWSKKIDFLLKNDKLREKMGEASLKKVRSEFKWQLSVKKHLEVFKSLGKI